MTRYGSYYEPSRTHLSLDKDAPIHRPVTPAGEGAIVAIPEVGGLHLATNGARPDRRDAAGPTRTRGAHGLALMITRHGPAATTTRHPPDLP